MPALPHSQPLQLGGTLTPANLAQMCATPAVALINLWLCLLVEGKPFTGPYLILSLIVFSLTYPGRSTNARGMGAVIRDVLFNWFGVVALLLLLGWASTTLEVFDRQVIERWVVTTAIALVLTHLMLPLALPRLMAAEGVQRVAVMAGGGELAWQLTQRIHASPYHGIRVAGFFDDRTPARLNAQTYAQANGPARQDILGGLGLLASYAKHHHVDLIYITLPVTQQPRILKLLDELRDTTASVYFVPDIFLFDLIQARLDSIGGMPVVAVCETPFHGMNSFIKRASDLVLASLILLLIAPIMIAIAIAIRLGSPGPALFKQRRYGLDGKEIMVYKFRTMKVMEDGGEIRQATRNDDRVTPLGALLRKTSLDELPQFFNVLQGRMSVVGPRPHAVAHNELYRKLIHGYMIRHKVRPGITGWAQVNGLRGETESLDKMRARIEYDLAYLRNWSLLLDLKIILKTLLVVWKKQNAY
ncbi:MAG TPA: undecaprenyl-phosphate glucose phosphotransferase [Rhodocyclaceae bacterium]|nr:undecaprenyl-phosphate glucose phosphotransferase [Rhodocyclaceae bacterium]